ncbi:MAG TPA: ATP-binding protein [Bacteroidales bacterium]|nr:ATP-binding protein [Bacteroidales bacterium]
MARKDQHIRILFAEDLPTDVELAKRVISKEGIQFDYTVVETEEAFRQELDHFHPDIVVSDYSMPTFDGMSALKITRAHEGYFPFIILTGSMNEETAVKCMKAGANDYVIKEQIKRLPYAILEAIENNKAKVDKARIEDQLVLSEKRFRILFDIVPNIAIAGHDINGRISYWNQAAVKLFGYSKKDVRNKSIFELIVPDDLKDDLTNNLQNIYESELRQPAEELNLLKKDGSLCSVQINFVVIKIFGKIKEIYTIMIDLTERNRMIQDLVNAKNQAEESDRLKSAFLMNMSHEIRTPMNGIMGFTDLLTRPQLTGEQKEQYISIIQSSGQRMLSTVNDIIEISRIESGEVSVCFDQLSVSKTIHEMCTFFSREAEDKGLTLKCQDVNEDYIIYSDKSKLQSILSNLIKNAIKYTKTGEIKVLCKKRKEKKDYIFSVSDSGIGIPKNRQHAIFNRFEQADIADTHAYQGSGLGLSIAKSYVEMLNGSIWVEAEAGEGSTFFFNLPEGSKDTITEAS